jgi:hypothetical protein
MATSWVVTTGATAVPLGAGRAGEVVFTVTNSGPVQDRAVFTVAPGEGAERSWFTVEEPQRLLSPGTSASYLVKVAVPPGAPAGSHTFQGQVYSADTAPEENSALSGRIVLTVGDGAPRPRPWWLLAVAGLVVVVLGVVALILFRGDDPPPPPPPPNGVVAVPDLRTLPEQEAADLLRDLGLAVGAVTRIHVPDSGRVVLSQAVDPGTEVPTGTVVPLEVAVQLSAPRLLAPTDGSSFPPGAPVPALVWQPVADADSYLVQVLQEHCRPVDLGGRTCTFREAVSVTVDGTELTPELTFSYFSFFLGGGHTGDVRWRVTPLDDTGAPGPVSDPMFAFQMRPPSG